jgi:dTDP-4-dehydrorhamnose 3,5-epimerase
MNLIETSISGAVVIEPQVYGDERGFFLETFHVNKYISVVGTDQVFVQDNHSRSSKGVLRGLHFQKSKPQGKLVRVVRGEVFDVAVDIRPDSPTFGQWEGVILNEVNKKQFWIPPGLAHGFLVLSDVADFEYKCTDYYDPSDEGSLVWNDADIAIEWPLDLLDGKELTLSDKDLFASSLDELTRSFFK